MRKRWAGKVEILQTDVPEELAAEIRLRYQPVVARCLELAAIRQSADFEQLLMSVYLQGLMDGANPQVQARLREAEK